MKRLDEGKVSLVDFLSSIKFAGRDSADRQSEYANRFADFSPKARPGSVFSAEDSQLIRSAN